MTKNVNGYALGSVWSLTKLLLGFSSAWFRNISFKKLSSKYYARYWRKVWTDSIITAQILTFCTRLSLLRGHLDN